MDPLLPSTFLALVFEMLKSLLHCYQRQLAFLDYSIKPGILLGENVHYYDNIMLFCYSVPVITSIRHCPGPQLEVMRSLPPITHLPNLEMQPGSGGKNQAQAAQQQVRPS